jgi:hypothetical protein
MEQSSDELASARILFVTVQKVDEQLPPFAASPSARTRLTPNGASSSFLSGV